MVVHLLIVLALFAVGAVALLLACCAVGARADVVEGVVSESPVRVPR